MASDTHAPTILSVWVHLGCGATHKHWFLFYFFCCMYWYKELILIKNFHQMSWIAIFGKNFDGGGFVWECICIQKKHRKIFRCLHFGILYRNQLKPLSVISFIKKISVHLSFQRHCSHCFWGWNMIIFNMTTYDFQEQYKKYVARVLLYCKVKSI